MKRHLFLVCSLLVALMTINSYGFAQMTMLVADGTSTNEYIPINGDFNDASQQQQFIYPGNMLMDMAGSTISSMTWYLKTLPAGTWDGEYSIHMGSVDVATFQSSAMLPISNTVEVYSGVVTINTSTRQVTINFTTPYTYTGGNLLVDVQKTTPGFDHGYALFYGIDRSNSSIYTYDWNGVVGPNRQHFLPKTSFTYVGGSLCLSPSDLTVLNATSNSATVTWHPRTENTQYQVYCGVANEDLSNVEWVLTADTVYTFQNLTPNTNHTAYVKTYCGTETSGELSVSFYTECDNIISSFPWSEGFEENWKLSHFFGQHNNTPPCWRVYNGGTTERTNGDGSFYWKVNQNPLQVHSGQHSAICKTEYAVGRHNDWLITPMINLTGEQKVSFYAQNHVENTTLTEEISVWISDENIELQAPESDTAALPGFTQLYQTEIPVGSFQFYEVSMAGYSGNRYIAFVRRYSPNSGWNLCLDDVTVDNIPPCATPVNLSAIPSAEEAQLSWIADVDSFNLYYKPSESELYTCIRGITLSENGTYTLTGLNFGTSYNWYVEAICPNQSLMQSAVASFNTTCEAITRVPKTWDFEHNLISGTANYPLPACWNRTGSTVYPYVYINPYAAHEGIACLYSGSNLAGVVAVLPPIAPQILPINILQIRFFAKVDGGLNGDIEVGIMTDPSDVTTFESVRTLNTLTENFAEYKVSFAQVSTAAEYIAFRINSTDNIYIDDVVLEEIPECDRPTNLQLSDLNSHSVNISWSSSAEEHHIYYQEAGHGAYVMVEDSVITGTSYLLDNLTPNTTYNIYVSSMCSNGTEIASYMTSFTTECIALDSIPYFWDFEDNSTAGALLYPMQTCWKRLGVAVASSLYVANSLAMAHSGSYCLYSVYPNNYIAVLPYIDTQVLPLDILQLGFYAKSNYGRNAVLEVGVITDVNDASTFESISSINLTQYYHKYEVSFTQYSGSASHVAFRMKSGTDYVVIDDVVLELAPICSKPSNLECVSMNSSSVSLSWQPGGYETSWLLTYGPRGFNPDEAQHAIQTSVSEMVISSLSQDVSYDFYVRANCGEEGFSGWLGLYNITPGHYNMKAQGTDTLYTCDATIFDDGGPNGEYSGGSDSYLVIFPSEENSYVEISGSLIAENCIWDYLVVYDGTSTDHEMYRSNQQGYDTLTIPTITSHSGPLTIYFHSDNAVSEAGFALNVTCVSCVAPRMAINEISMNSAVVVVEPQETGNHTYELVYGPTGFNPDTVRPIVVNNNTLSYTISGLSPNTSYDVYIRTFCIGDTSYSAWSHVNTFSTLSFEPAVLPYVCDFEDEVENALWTIENGSYTNQWYINTAVNNTINGNSSLYISNDNGTTNSYQIEGATSTVWSYRDIQFPEDEEMFVLSFDWKCYGEGYSYNLYDYLSVYIGKPMQIHEGVEQETEDIVLLGKLYMQPNWSTTYYLLGNEYANTTKRLYFLWKNDESAGSNPPAAIDNISLKKMNCSKPIDNLTITDITDSSAVITITATDENAMAWQLRYDDNMVTVTEGTSYTLTNLIPASQYVVYARSICHNGDTSLWTLPNVFMTDCHSITDIPYHCDFGHDNYGGTEEYPLPVCWQRTGDSEMYPSVFYLYMDGNANYVLQSGPDPINSIAVLPEIDTSKIHIRDLMLSFNALMDCDAENTYTFEIGVMSNPNDPLTFVPVGTVNTLTFTYTAYEVALNAYAGTGTYIALRFNAVGGIDVNGHYSYANIFIDDVVLDYIPSCRKPNYLRNLATTDTSARITWTPEGNENDWEVKWGPHGFNPELMGLTIYATNNELVINNLYPLAPYDFYVRAHCGDNLYSEWEGPLTVIPGSYNMMATGVDTLYTCDVVIYDNGGAYADYSDRCDAYLVIYPDGPDRMVEISGTIMADEYFFDYLVFYDGAGVEEDLGEELYRSHQEEGVQTTIPPVLSPSGPMTVYFHSDYTISYAGFELNVTCKSCITPTVSVSALYLDSAVASWTTPVQSANDFELVYGPSGFNPNTATAIQVSGRRSYPLMGLTMNTAYDVYVRAICEEGYSEWSNVCKFNTLSSVPASVPYACDFENTTENSQWTILNGNQRNKWYINAMGSDNKFLYVSDNSGATNTYNITSPSDVWAYRDFMFPSNAEYTLSFDWLCHGENLTTIQYDYFEVFIGDPVTVSAGSPEVPVNVVSLGRFNMQDSWTRSTVSISREHTGGIKRLYFLWNNDNNGGDNPAAAIDNINIDALYCVQPIGAEISNITSNSAHISITHSENNVSGWQLMYGDNLVTVMNDTATDIHNLQTGVEYSVSVRSICMNGDTSLWYSAGSFTTECGTIGPSSLPYTCGFEGNNTGGSEFYPFPACWQRIGDQDNPYVSNYDFNAHQGSHYLTSGMDADNFFVILPEINTEDLPINELQLGFYARLNDYSGLIDVGVMTNPNIPLTFTPISTINNLTANYAEYEVSFAQYSGYGTYIAFRLNSTGTIDNYGYHMYALIDIDDVTLDYIPDCPQPGDLAQNNVTSNSADLSWADVANSYVLYYKEFGTADYTVMDNVTLTNGVYTLTGLTPLTSYEWYVASVCDNGSVIQSHSAGSFTTLCEVVNDFPYIESFEHGLGCWLSSVVMGVDGQWQRDIEYGPTQSPINSADGNFYAQAFNYGTGNIYRLSSPVFDLTSLQEPYIKFYHVQLVWGSDQDYLRIYYKTSSSAQPVLLVSYDNSIYPWRLDSLSLPNPSESYQLLFDAYLNFGYGVGLDRVVVYDLQAGDEPNVEWPVVVTDPATEVTQTSAKLKGRIVDMGNQVITLRGFEWKETAGGIYTPLLDAGAEATLTCPLTGLTANTQYTYRAFVATADTIIYGSERWFTTATEEEHCDTPDDLRVCDLTPTTAELCWSAGNGSSWVVEYKLQSCDEDWNSQTVTAPYAVIENLSENNSYEARVKAICDDEYESDYATITFNTPVGINEFDFTQNIELRPNPAEYQIELYANCAVMVDKLEIYNAMGQLIKTMMVENNHAYINLDNMSSGIYVARIYVENAVVSKKFIKR
jgi:hypothetical protein